MTGLMTKQSLFDCPIKAKLSGPLFRGMVLRAIKKMEQGFLHLTLPDGEQLCIGNPDSPVYANIQIRDERFYSQLILYGHIGFAEAYMEGYWETNDIASVIMWAILNSDNSQFMEDTYFKFKPANLLGTFNKLLHRMQHNNLKNSKSNIQRHYDLSNEFFNLFLDPTMTYSSAYFQNPEQTLESAQTAKYEALCQKLHLQPSDSVLEIGTGWGGFCSYAAKTYGCKITSLTLSKKQLQFAQARMVAEGLAGQVTIRLEDYRHCTGQFDKIASIEMLEAVGDAYMETFFGKCSQLLTKSGLLGIQYITCPDSRYKLLKSNVDFIQKYIFPGSLLPSVGRVNQAINRTGDLSLHELEDMGNSYAKTLHQWYLTFNKKLTEVKALGFDERFIRMWNYYLEYCRAAFSMRHISVVQAVYTRPNNLSLSDLTAIAKATL